MAAIGFIGLGNMGLPMARNLLKAGHQLVGFDVVGAARRRGLGRREPPARRARPPRAPEVVLTMLPEGRHVREVYLGEAGSSRAPIPSLLIDCSTIDVDSARRSTGGCGAGLEVLDARRSRRRRRRDAHLHGRRQRRRRGARPPDPGGDGQDGGAHRGVGQQQAAKICNNMLLAISMIGVCRRSSSPSAWAAGRQAVRGEQPVVGQCWALTGYCPVPELVPARRQTGSIGRLHRRRDGQGSASGPERGAKRRCADPDGRAGARAVRAVRQPGTRRARFLGDHQDDR